MDIHEQSRRPANEEPQAAAGKRRVLVADDNADSALSLAMIVKIPGHEAQTAHDGLAALALAESYRPEVCILDLGMPKLNGYDVCQRIRAQEWGRSMLLIALTGWGQEDDRSRAQQAGFDHHFVKPIDGETLKQLLAG